MPCHSHFRLSVRYEWIESDPYSCCTVRHELGVSFPGVYLCALFFFQTPPGWGRLIARVVRSIHQREGPAKTPATKEHRGPGRLTLLQSSLNTTMQLLSPAIPLTHGVQLPFQ